MEARIIRGLLIIAGTNANRLARKIGVSRQAMYQTINGDIAPLRIRNAIAKEIGKPISDIWPDASDKKIPCPPPNLGGAQK